MLIVIFLCLLMLFFVLILFSFPQLSPIPYFPTNKKDLPLIIKALNLKNNQTVIDFGAGDGIVIFSAAKQAFNQKLNTTFIAIEINPVLVLILYLRRLFNPNKKNINIIWGDMFKINLKTQISNLSTIKQYNNVTIYIYISPWMIDRLVKNLIPPMAGKNFSIVSYMYPRKNKQPTKIIPGFNKIYLYHL